MFLPELTEYIQTSRKEVLVGEDFNAVSPSWGLTVTDVKGG